MKFIYENKLYDTDKAELITTLQSCDWSAREYYFKSKKGNYFCIKKYLLSSEFRLCTEDEIKKTLSKYDADKYIELFGNVEEG